MTLKCNYCGAYELNDKTKDEDCLWCGPGVMLKDATND